MATHPLPFRHRFGAMGCPAEICLYAGSRESASAAFALVEEEVNRLDRKYSHYRDDSDLASMLRDASRPQGVRVDDETAALLHFSDTQHRLSEGRFDITAERLSALWDRRTCLPSAGDIAGALALTGWSKVNWSGAGPDGPVLKLPAGMRLDLGGVVKEYAVDRAAFLLKSAGYAAGYVDLGGDLNVLGPHPGGKPWIIGIRNPRGPGAIAAVQVSRGGLATSGDYERCSLIGGKRYSHIIDPRTGWPVQGLASVSVMAPTCLLAGAMSTLALLLNPEEAIGFLAASGLRWLAHDGHCSRSDGNGMLRPVPEPSTPRDPRKPLHETLHETLPETVQPARTTYCH